LNLGRDNFSTPSNQKQPVLNSKHSHIVQPPEQQIENIINDELIILPSPNPPPTPPPKKFNWKPLSVEPVIDQNDMEKNKGPQCISDGKGKKVIWLREISLSLFDRGGNNIREVVFMDLDKVKEKEDSLEIDRVILEDRGVEWKRFLSYPSNSTSFISSKSQNIISLSDEKVRDAFDDGMFTKIHSMMEDIHNEVKLNYYLFLLYF
jgi:hypothetical protein